MTYLHLKSFNALKSIGSEEHDFFLFCIWTFFEIKYMYSFRYNLVNFTRKIPSGASNITRDNPGISMVLHSCQCVWFIVGGSFGGRGMCFATPSFEFQYIEKKWNETVDNRRRKIRKREIVTLLVSVFVCFLFLRWYTFLTSININFLLECLYLHLENWLCYLMDKLH